MRFISPPHWQRGLFFGIDQANTSPYHTLLSPPVFRHHGADISPRSIYFQENPRSSQTNRRIQTHILSLNPNRYLERSVLDGGEDAQFELRGVAVELHVCDVPFGELHPSGAGGGGGGVGDDGDVVERVVKRGAG